VPDPAGIAELAGDEAIVGATTATADPFIARLVLVKYQFPVELPVGLIRNFIVVPAGMFCSAVTEERVVLPAVPVVPEVDVVVQLPANT
jgi:hypothetical protein